MLETTNFLPDWALPPGATIKDILEERGLSSAELARGLHGSIDHVEKLLRGSTRITEGVAKQLAATLDTSEAFWLSRESQYRDALTRLKQNEEWVKKLPFNDMVRFGWVLAAKDVSEKIATCLEHFGVATVADWTKQYENTSRLAAFRTSPSFESHEGAVLAWLRKGEIDAQGIKCAAWNSDRFRDSLVAIRSLTREKNPGAFLPELKRLCAECGVAVVIVRAPTGCRASGATRFLTPKKALLMLSGRYLSDDHFWFTFFHEAGHLALHGQQLFLEGDALCTGKEEDEANEFSSNLLVSPADQVEMCALPRDGRAVMRFARKIGISPGIVVGQLQHRGIFPRNALNNLKVRYSWDA